MNQGFFHELKGLGPTFSMYAKLSDMLKNTIKHHKCKYEKNPKKFQDFISNVTEPGPVGPVS